MLIKCQICGYKCEDSKHVFLNCWWAAAIWNDLDLMRGIELHRFVTVTDWLHYCHDNYSESIFRLVMLSTWYIWYNRNEVFHGKPLMSPISSADKIRCLSKGYEQQVSVYDLYIRDVDMNWVVPPPTYHKLNCDASFDLSSGTSAIAYTIRDDKGTLHACQANGVHNIPCAFEAEGRCILEGLKLAEALHIDKLIIESDCLEAVKAIQSCCLLSSTSNEWLHPCQQMLLRNKHWKLFLIRREANKLADHLATKSRIEGWSWLELDCCPTVVSRFIQL